MADEDQTQLTYYGYEQPGDPDYDSNSAAGIGDHNNQLVDSYSAALTQSERLARFGVTGTSTGEEFEFQGRTYRDDDTAPEGNRRVDVYSPGGPGQGVSGYSETLFSQEQDPQTSDEEIRGEYQGYYPIPSDPPPSQPVPQEQGKQVSPLDKVRAEFPALSKLTEDQQIAKLHDAFTDVPMDKFAVYAKQPNGSQLIKDELGRGLSPLEKFKKFYPDRTTGKNDDQVIEWMHDHLEPQTPLDQFKEKVNPPNPVINGLISGVKQGLSQIGQGLGSEAFKQGALAGAQQTYGKWEQMPKAGTDVLDGLYKAAGVYGWEKSASSWLQKNVPGYGAANDYFVKFVGDLNNRGKEFEKQADQSQAAIPKTAEGQVAGTLGEAAGSIPDIAVSFGLGGTGKAAALFGMSYEGISAYGHAIENQQKNALQQGVSAAGFRGFAQYLMNTGQGRLVIGLANSVASVSEEEVQKWLRGEPNDIAKDGKTATVGFLMGLLMGGKRPPSEYKSPSTFGLADPVPPGPLRGDVTEGLGTAPEAEKDFDIFKGVPKTIPQSGVLGPETGLETTWFSQPPIQTRIGLGPLTPEELARGVSLMPSKGSPKQMSRAAEGLRNRAVLSDPESGLKPAPHFTPAQLKGEEVINPSGRPEEPTQEHKLTFTFDHHTPPVAEELNKAQEAHQNGDTDRAAAHIDKAIAVMPKEQASKLAGEAIDKVNELAASHADIAKPKPESKTGDPFADKPGTWLEDYNKAKAEMPNAAESDVRKRASEITRQRNTEPYAIGKLREINPEAADEYGKMSPKKQASYLEQLQSSNPQWNPKSDFFKGKKEDDFNDYYFAGIPFSPKAIRDFLASTYEATGAEKVGRKLRGVWRPESVSETAETFGQIVKSEEARSKQAQARLPAQIARDNNVLDVLKNGDRSEVRERFFSKFTQTDRINQFLDYQEGKPLKDPTANSIWERVYRPVYDMLAKREEYYGIEHEVRQNYFQQLFSHPLDEQTRLREDVRKQAGGPAYTKEREMTYREHIERGDKPVTTNPERLMQMRWRASELAIQKIRDMMQLEEQGGAYEVNRTDIPPRVKNHRWGIMSTANGKNFYVHPDVNAILNNKFNSHDVYRGAAGFYFKFMSALKGTTAGLLSWSAFHPLHELDIITSDMSANSYQRRVAGVGTWEDAMNEALNWIPGLGIPHVGAVNVSGFIQGARMSIRYKGLVNALKGLVDQKDITEEMHRDMRDIKDMGISVEVNRERMMQFSEGIRNLLPRWIQEAPDGHLISMGAKGLGMIYKGVTASPFTHWWFGAVQPRLKVASALMRRDALLATRPDLFKASKRGELLREYGKIQRDVEGRFGELNYDNLLWPKWLKQVGTTHMLSLGWQLGLLRTMGDGVIDMTTNVAHMDEIMARSKNLNELERNMVTNRMAFQSAYMGRGMLTGLAMTYLLGRVAPTLWDAFYPRVGKNPDGSDKRVNMQYFTKDIPAINEYSKQEGSWLVGILRMGLNKMNPAAMTALQALTNKDYMGRPIGDLPAQIAYFLRNSFVPISLQNITRIGPKDATDIIMDILGYSPSARWTQRSALENEIIQKSFAKPGQDISDAREEYRQAYLTHDREGMMKARKKLKDLKATDRQIANIEKEAHLSSAQKAWKHLSNAKKAEMLEKMSPEDRAKWLKLSPHVTTPIHPSGYYAPRNPREALALGPGTKFMDPYGKLRMVPQNA